MGSKDGYYPNIPTEMAEALDKIVEEDIRLMKYGIRNKGSLIIKILATAIANYEETNNIMKSIRNADVVAQLPSQKLKEKIERLLDMI